MRVGTPRVTRTRDTYRYAVDVSGRELWYEAPYPMIGSADAAAVGLLIPAMAAGEEMVVEGPLSEQLLFSLSTTAQHVLTTLQPGLNLIPVSANVAREPIESRGVATGFSAGVDSFSVLADHYFGDGVGLTHLLFNNVGSHRLGEPLWRDRFERVAPAAERMGLPIIPVNSNLDDFYDLGFVETHTVRNASVPLLMGFATFLYASGCAYEECTLEATNRIALTDPFLLPLLRTETQRLLSVGCEYTRIEKTLQIARVEESHRSLDVCISGRAAGNCSRCEKCLRTQFTLDLAGLLHLYDAVFDPEIYAREREPFVRHVLMSDRPMHRRIVAFGESVGAFTAVQKLRAAGEVMLRRALRR